MLSQSVLDSLDAIRGDFQTARPFRHACIENFFDEEQARQLLAEFPVFEPENAINEFGKIGRKAVRTNLRDIGPTYARLYDYLRSPAFLDRVSQMVGIPDLLFDDAMYGGGTHENLEGQELDPHIDFNYDQVHGYHRRLNMLVYLNEEWSTEWGGAIQLHSNPWDWEGDQVKTFNATFNRCVIFETNEYSWHGFERIRLPEDKKGRTRKCISIYLYTRERSAEEVAPPHGTFYVQRPLPARMVEGHALSAEDVAELRGLLKKRDNFIRMYQKHELSMSAERQRMASYLDTFRAALRFPMVGPVRQASGSAFGLHADDWVERHAGARFVARQSVDALRLAVWIPDSFRDGQQLSVMLNGKDCGTHALTAGDMTTIRLDHLGLTAGEFALELRASHALEDDSGDERERAYVISEIEFME